MYIYIHIPADLQVPIERQGQSSVLRLLHVPRLEVKVLYIGCFGSLGKKFQASGFRVSTHVESDRRPCALFTKIRNPHATNEWFGRFHDDDWETWNAYPEVRTQLWSLSALWARPEPETSQGTRLPRLQVTLRVFKTAVEALKATGHKVGIKDRALSACKRTGRLGKNPFGL